MEVLVWTAAAVVLAVAELLTVSLVLAMFAVGAVAAAVAAGLGASLPWQLAVFVLVSAGSLGAVRPVLRRHRHRAVRRRAAGIGVENLVGTVAVVRLPVTADAGQVRIDGELWSARAEPGAAHAAGDRVRVTSVDGATVTVAAASDSEGEQ